MKRIQAFNDKVDRAQTILISTHIFPDADGIGSQVALCLALRELGKEAYCVNESGIQERYHYLDPQNVVMSVADYKELSPFKDREIDLFIVVDASSLSRVGPHTQMILESAKSFLFVDHHPCSPATQAIHCIDTSMAATGQLVGKLIDSLKVPLSQEMALALYTSVLIDTSSFRYPTVTASTHRLLARCLDTGVEPPFAYNKIYGTKRPEHIRFLGKVLSHIQSTKDGHIAWLAIPEKDVKNFQSDLEDTHSFINHLLVLENIKVACMFRSVGHQVRVSLRSLGDIDVGEIAQALGGGGHQHSAATVYEGSLKSVVKQTIHNIQLILRSMSQD